MQLANIIGNATATVKHPTLKGQKLLIAQPLGASGSADGDPVLMIDHLGCGIGDQIIFHKRRKSSQRNGGSEQHSDSLRGSGTGGLITMDAQLIEDVVQSVLRELRGGSAGASCSMGGSSGPSKPSGLTITDAVVTEATLAGRLSGVREVVFSAKTVLTPTAKDYLRSHQISWSRSGASVGGASAEQVGPRVVATHSTVAVGSAFNGGDLVRVSVADAARVVSEGIGDGVVMVLTARPHSLAIELNRTNDIRAIALDDLSSAACAIRDSRANCVCAKPNGRSKDELEKLARVVLNCRGRV